MKNTKITNLANGIFLMLKYIYLRLNTGLGLVGMGCVDTIVNLVKNTTPNYKRALSMSLKCITDSIKYKGDHIVNISLGGVW